MRTFLMAQISSFGASIVDLVVTFLLVEQKGLSYAVAICIGAIVGAFTNFLINRYLIFRARNRSISKQTYRYIIVWGGSLFLNIVGVYLFTILFNVSYVVTKIIVSIIVGLTFNYVLQKKYVFTA